MASTELDGPLIVYGRMGNIQPGVSNENVPDPNSDAGPSLFYQGAGIPDVRFWFPKDQVVGYKGRVPSMLDLSYLQSVEQVPAASGTALIAAAANVTSGVAMTLAGAATGVAVNIPIIPFASVFGQSAVVTAPIVLDFGFAWGNVTSGSTTITVADATQFPTGMPLVIAGVGNSGGTAPLLTFVTGAPTATTITVNDAPQATNSATPIGTGNAWYPSGSINSGEPVAHMPYLAAGPDIFLDPLQSVARAVSITGSSSATGGAFTVRGWDIYWQPMAETITVGAGAVTQKGKKAFKAIASVTPGFTDAHNYSAGTTDTFGMHVRSDKWEYSNFFFNASFGTTANGWTAAATATPTATTGDVRGTIDVTNASGFNSSSNGTVSGLVMTGRRLAIFSSMPLWNTISGTPDNPVPMFGQTQYYA